MAAIRPQSSSAPTRGRFVSQSKTPSSTRYAKDPPPEQVAATRIRLDIPIDVREDADYFTREAEAMRVAEEAFAKTGKWVVFHRTMLGLDGAVLRLFPEPKMRQRFYRSRAMSELQEMIAAMRSTDTSKSDATEPERMITIRLPMTLHEVLSHEADAADLSINQWCISKLIQPLQDRHVPEPQGQRRGRKPGPQGSKKRRS